MENSGFEVSKQPGHPLRACSEGNVRSYLCYKLTHVPFSLSTLLYQYKREVELTAAETQRLAGIKRGLKRGEPGSSTHNVTYYVPCNDLYPMYTCCINVLVNNKLYLCADLKRAQDAGDMQARSLAAIQEKYVHPRVT